MKKILLVLTIALLAAAVAVSASADTAWSNAYRDLVSSGAYRKYITHPDPEWAEIITQRDTTWDRFALHDMDGDRIPELIVYTEYGYEQADVFTFDGRNAVWLGSMGGDNFFQVIVYYEDTRYPGLFTFMGGPAMKIDNYTVANGRLQRKYFGQTIVDFEGMETIGIDTTNQDKTLYRMLLDTAAGPTDTSRDLAWYLPQSLQSSSDWADFVNSATGLR